MVEAACACCRSCGATSADHVRLAARVLQLDRSALLPLYLDPEREVELGQLRLPCSGTEASWLQAGAALFLSGGEL